jgi:FlaA1/EpsC-like NDP-sugar epimerase
LLFGRLFLGQLNGHFIFPFSIIIMEGALSFLGMVGVRFVPRIRSERTRTRDSGMATLIIGAGQGGLAVVKEAVRHPELGMRPIGFLDDDPARPAWRSARCGCWAGCATPSASCARPAPSGW